MLDRIRGWLGNRDIPPVGSPTRPTPTKPPAPAPRALGPVDHFLHIAPANNKFPVAQVAFAPGTQSHQRVRPVVQGRLGDVNPADPQFQALLGRLYGPVKVQQQAPGVART